MQCARVKKSSCRALLILTFLLIYISQCSSVPLSSFYPNEPLLDTVLPPNDDGFSDVISLTTPFSFFGATQTSLYVSIIISLFESV